MFLTCAGLRCRNRLALHGFLGDMDIGVDEVHDQIRETKSPKIP